MMAAAIVQQKSTRRVEIHEGVKREYHGMHWNAKDEVAYPFMHA